MKRTLITMLTLLLLLTGCHINIVFRGNVETREATSSTGYATIKLNTDLIQSKGIDVVEVESNLIDDFDHPVSYRGAGYVKPDQTEVSHYFGSYGKHEVTVIYKKDNKTVDTEVFDFIFTSDEYNIALLRATLPVTYFSMLMTKENDSVKLDNTIPTVIALERANSYNWNSLYPNMYSNPFSNNKKIKNNTTDDNYFYSQFISEMQAYVRYLHELNPNSKFHFILNDLSVDILFKLAYENGLTEDQFSVLFLSDGSGSYSYLRSIYGDEENNDSPSLEIYEKYENVLKTSRQKALQGDTSYIDDITALNSSSDKAFYGLLPALVNDSALDVQWIVNRKNKDTFGSSDVSVNKVVGSPNVTAFNLATHAATFSEDETQRLKKLFNFNITPFESAEKNGKKILIFLGTRAQYEANLEDELILMKALFPDGYAYFYKGHPGDSYNEERTKILERQGITALDASIPAELFLLFKPEVEMCGISSTTFESYTHDEIPFIVGYDTTWAYRDKVNTYVEVTGNSENPYKITRLKTKEYCYWSPQAPSVFDWQAMTE